MSRVETEYMILTDQQIQPTGHHSKYSYNEKNDYYRMFHLNISLTNFLVSEVIECFLPEIWLRAAACLRKKMGVFNSLRFIFYSQLQF